MRALLGASCALVLACGHAGIRPRGQVPPPDPLSSASVGAGYFTTQLEPGEAPPSDDHGKAVKPKVTSDFTGPVNTNDWWSSLIWQYDFGKKSNPYSAPLYPHPLAMQAGGDGLRLGYPDQPEVSERAYFFTLKPEVRVGAAGLDSPDTKVKSYSDWTVTASWSDGALEATLGHGLPFVYLRARSSAVVEALQAASEIKLDGETLAFNVGAHRWAAFAPRGSKWVRDGDRFTSDLGSKGFYSVAILPDASAETLALFKRHAYAFITESRVEWSYSPERAQVKTTFEVKAEAMEKGESAEPLLALYRHQWLHTAAPLTALSYASARGEMKLLEGRAFETAIPYHGVSPILPVMKGADRAQLRALVADAAADDPLFPAGLEGKKDTYWTGKSLGKVAVLAQLADQLGDAGLRDRLVTALANELEDWFDGRAPFLYYYDRTWSTLIGFPSGYFSGSQLNDHHFHNAHFVFAAATVAQFDPAWAQRDRWGGMVELLIQDAANWKRDDDRFPFLRNFDVYAGHSWANGPSFFNEGNNEESSSEDALFATAVALWGEATGDSAVRDLGVFLHAQLSTAIAQYWFDVDDAVFPKGFAHNTVGMLWSSGGKYDTWWTKEPIYVHGINFLPFTGGSLYLGVRPEYVKANYAALVKKNRGEVQQWRDVIWMYLALADPQAASKLMETDRYLNTEFGHSRAWMRAWVETLASAGTIDPAVTADSATAFVLRKDGVPTYVAHNPTSSERTVRFSDGAVVKAAPRTLTTQVGGAKSGQAPVSEAR
jgi:endoglucanase Acf2